MKILLIVGSANDVFIVNMSKWLKLSMPEVSIDIFEFYPTTLQDINIYADCIYHPQDHLLNNVRGVRSLIKPFCDSKALTHFLDGKYYDIIHCHWIVQSLVLTRGLKDHCKNLYATFWGGELENLKLLFSQRLYKNNLDRFVEDIDYIINSCTFKDTISTIYPRLATRLIEGYLGSAPLEKLYKLMTCESRVLSKTKLSIKEDKIVVLIGYSGKSLHQHIPIINELSTRNELKDKIHLIAPMTRGSSPEYCNKVLSKLEKSGYTYTLIRDCFLSDEDVARIRNATDVTLQLSATDGFSRSIVECLCAKSVLIYGEWLNYDGYMKYEGLSGHPVSSIKEGINKLIEVTNNIHSYKKEVELNSQNGYKHSLWSECIHDWVNAYKKNL